MNTRQRIFAACAALNLAVDLVCDIAESDDYDCLDAGELDGIACALHNARESLGSYFGAEKPPPAGFLDGIRQPQRNHKNLLQHEHACHALNAVVVLLDVEAFDDIKSEDIDDLHMTIRGVRWTAQIALEVLESELHMRSDIEADEPALVAAR